MPGRITRVVDALWPRALVACALLAVVIAGLAYASQPAVQDDDRVRDTVTDFVNAAADRDGDRACALLSAQGRTAVTALVPGVPCPVYARSFGFDVSGLGGLDITVGRDVPDHVVLDARNTRGPDGRPITRRIALSRVGKDFRIDGIAG